MKGIPVLMYHALEDKEHPAGAKDLGEQLYVLQVSQFREQMAYLKQEGYQTFLLEELSELDEWPEKSIVLTFDDGHESNYTLALPILQEFGFRAEFFVTTGWIGTPHFMTAEQIRALSKAGMGIGSHGVTHSFVDDLSDGEIAVELKDSRLTLEHIIANPVTTLSLPGGRILPVVDSIAKDEGYLSIGTSRPGFLEKDNGLLNIPRFSLQRNIDIETYRAIVLKKAAQLIKLAIKNAALKLVKKIVGSKSYVRVRDFLLDKSNL